MGISAREIREGIPTYAGGDKPEKVRAEHVPGVSRSFQRPPWSGGADGREQEAERRENGTQNGASSFQDSPNEAARLHAFHPTH